ncbi:MAG: substrate-binding domain-containing protein [Armatimonadota bacterium]|nr:substrate-binding domain-containing protein [Armatimonadota bacterium]
MPDDIAVTGFDGIEEGQTLDRPLTTVRVPVEALCERALQILLSRVSGDRETPSQQIVVPTTLLVGETA